MNDSPTPTVTDIIVIHPFGRLSHQDEGTVLRCMAAVQLIFGRLFPQSYRVILTAGYTRKRPELPTLEHRVSLAEEIANFLVKRGVPPYKIIAEPRCWGSVNEIVEAMKIIDERGFRPDRIYDVTDIDHAARTEMVWKAIAPQNWEILMLRCRAIMDRELVVREKIAALQYRTWSIPHARWRTRHIRKKYEALAAR
jgi:hypothetical protein